MCIADIAKFIPGLGEISSTTVLPSSVTTSWQIRWTEEMIARDLYQNFVDGNRDNYSDIHITRLSDTAVVISAPNVFDLHDLYYLGSHKSLARGDIGGFGEGFKAGSVALLRDHNVQPIVISGRHGVRVTTSDAFVSKSEMRPLVYEYFDHTGDTKGTHLILMNLGPKLMQAILDSSQWFFDPSHRAISGKPILIGTVVDIYPTKLADGLAFYQGQLCSKLPGIQIIVNFKAERRSLSNHFTTDRDRKLVNNEKMDIYYSAMVKDIGVKYTPAILKASRKLWKIHGGHPLLHQLALAISSSGAIDASSWVANKDDYYVDYRDELNALLNSELRQSIMSEARLQGQSPNQQTDYLRTPQPNFHQKERHDKRVCEEENFYQEAQSKCLRSRIPLPVYFENFGIPSVFSLIKDSCKSRSQDALRQISLAVDQALKCRAEIEKTETEEQERALRLALIEKENKEKQDELQTARKDDGEKVLTVAQKGRLIADRIAKSDLLKQHYQEFVVDPDDLQVQMGTILFDAYNHVISGISDRSFRFVELPIQIIRNGGDHLLPFFHENTYCILIPERVFSLPLRSAFMWLARGLDELQWHKVQQANPNKPPPSASDIALAYMEEDFLTDIESNWKLSVSALEKLRGKVEPAFA
jgi:hypothetical protein